MIVVAGAAILINAGIGLALHRGSKHDINVRSAYLHMVGDAISAFGVMLAGVVVTTTGSSLADPLVSLVIAAFILYSSYGVLRESATILLEGTPAGLDNAGGGRGDPERGRRPRGSRPARLDGRSRRRRLQLPHRRGRAERA